jgi:transketolase
MRNAFARTLHQCAREQGNIFVVAADISPAGSMGDFRNDFPDQFINVGVAEQSMISLAAGLALRGAKPFAYSIATFAIYRPFEMVRDDVCYQNLPVTIVGVGGGVSYSTLGGTHYAQEDIALMSALPGMSILAPCDPFETEQATRAAAHHAGPLYLRLGKAGEPDLSSHAPEPFVFGKLRKLREGQGTCILSYGPIVGMALEVASDLAEKRGAAPAVYSVHTLKPLDKEGLAEILARYDEVLVVEEHSCLGGLGAQLKELAWDRQAKCRIHAFSLREEFVHYYGSQRGHWEAHGLSRERIVAHVG